MATSSANTGYYASKFTPPANTDTPQSLFAPGTSHITRLNLPDLEGIVTANHHRLVRRSDEYEILIYTGGVCLSDGQQNGPAGCGIVFYPDEAAAINKLKYGTFVFRLEKMGPTGEAHPPTNNRAALRAVIGGLQFRNWNEEAWKKVVIATSSDYVVDGATEWVKKWETNGWVTGKKKAVSNRDLWELLMKEVRKYKRKGLEVVFWRIERDQNREANAAAHEALGCHDVERFERHGAHMLNAREMVYYRFLGSDIPGEM